MINYCLLIIMKNECYQNNSYREREEIFETICYDKLRIKIEKKTLKKNVNVKQPLFLSQEWLLYL